MRRRVAVAVVVVLVAALAWWAERPTPDAQVATPAPSAPSIPVVATAPARQAPVPAPSVDAVDQRAATQVAIAALAEASGRYAVVCPPLPDSDGTSWTHPEGATCAMTAGIACAASQPAGSVVVRHDDDTPVAVYRWDTRADGTTTCVIERPAEGQVRVQVLDRHAEPRVGVHVSTSEMRALATTDDDGGATLPVVGTGTHWVIAIGDDGAVSPPAGVVAGGTATLVLGGRPTDLGPGDVLPEVRASRIVEALDDLETALEAPQPPEVARELGALWDIQQRGLDAFCETSDVPTCRAWRARR